MRIARHNIRHPWAISGLTALAVIGSLLIILWSIVPFSSEAARLRVIAALADHLDSEVELKALHWRVLPRLRAEGTGLIIRHKGRTDVPPMISVRSFAVEGNFLGLVKRHVSTVTLDGLDIEIPPRHKADSSGTASGQADLKVGTPREAPTPNGSAALPASPRRARKLPRNWVIDEMITTDGRMAIVPRRPDHDPKVWEIHHLDMQSVAFERAMPYHVTITNAIPTGEVTSSGTFGPWQSEDPGRSPIEGMYTFVHADLNIFKGIGGMLSAHGTLRGSIDRMETEGETDIPDFSLDVANHPIPLRTKYQAIVDGTNGETTLTRVDISFLRTSLVAKGGIFVTPGKHGRTLRLDVAMEQGRLEDVLRLVVKASQPPMTGGLQLKARLVLPPGKQDVIEKLRLDGRFTSAATKFVNRDVQRKINALSHKGRGKAPDETPQTVASDFVGTLSLAESRLTIPDVTFGVPGSTVRLAGTYDLGPETLNFAGMLLLDAKVSQTFRGFKSMLLKIVDPLFRKPGGGSAIPIRITGTRSDPQFGLDKGRVFHRK